MSGILLSSVGSKTVSNDPAIGSSYRGGFYAGKIIQGGTAYYIIISPKASGESSSKQWKTSNTEGPSATRTLNNGSAASSSMNSSDYPAAQFCEGLTIGGFSDWYLPSRDELEVCYRNLKPGTGSNSTGSRIKSLYTYPEGDDVTGDTIGINRNSSPTGAAYTSSVPAQTTLSAFQYGGSEAFTFVSGQAVRYLTSSELSSGFAWSIVPFSGNQIDTNKDQSNYVRAIRRESV